MLEYKGTAYPAVIFPAPESQWFDLESVLAKPLIKERGKDYLIRGSEYFEGLKRTWRERGTILDETVNRDTYRMLKLYKDNDNKLKLKVGLGTYFDVLLTSHALSWELLVNFGKKRPKPRQFSKFFCRLKLRKTLHDAVNDPITNGDGRCAGIGCSMLIIYKEKDEQRFYALLRERSKLVAADVDLYHVVPSLMFQRIVGTPEQEFSVTHQLYREYLEELFNIREVETLNTGPLRYDYFYNDPNLLYLNDLLRNKEAQLLFTGVAVDLLNLRPEICTLLLIKTSEWIDFHSRGNPEKRLKRIGINKEFKPPDKLPADRIITFPLNERLEIPPDVAARIRPERITAPGAAALFMGIEVACKMLS
ncbi:MAG: hypothetical protein ABDI20_09875 [Candidatus Bipolaricaulaceae bacterium]